MMHELVSNILGSSSDDIVAPIQLKPLSLPTLELVYSQLLISNKSQQQKHETAQDQESTPVPAEDGNNLVQIVSKLFNQKSSRKTAILGASSGKSASLPQEINDFWMLSAMSSSSVTQSMISASTSILLNAQVVRDARIRLGILNNIWKALKPPTSSTPAVLLNSSSKDEIVSNCSSVMTIVKDQHHEASSALLNSLNYSQTAPTLADIGCQTAFSVAVSFLRSCWRSSPANIDLCSDVLSSCVDALSNLPPGSLHSSALSIGVSTTLKKAREFLTNVARNSLPGVATVPDIDRQYAICILLYFAFAEGSLTSLLEIVSLLFELSSPSPTSNNLEDSQVNKNLLEFAPLKPALLKLINQIHPQYLSSNSPAADVIQKSEIFEQLEEQFSLQTASMLLMASIDCLVHPLFSTSPSLNGQGKEGGGALKTQILGWGISELISFGSHNINLPAGSLAGSRQEDVVDMTASQYFLVILTREGHVCQLPMCDLSPDIAATVITGSTGSDSCVYTNKNITCIASCPTSTNCLALASNGQMFYWDAAPTDREPPKVEALSLPEIFIVKIATGYMYQAGLSSDGIIYIWGRNQHGQLGTGGHQDESLPVQVAPIRGAKWVDVSLSASAIGYTAAVTEQGHVYTWGGGSYFRLAHGASFVPLRILSLEDVTSVFAGDNFTAAVTRTGKLEVWGRVFGDNQMPHEIDLLSQNDSVKTLSQNSNRLLVITNSGRILLYGRDFSRTATLSDTSGTSFLDDPTRPRVLANLDLSLGDESIKVKATCTPLAGFILITPDKRPQRRVLTAQGQENAGFISLTTCFQQGIETLSSTARTVDLLLQLFTLGIEKHDPNLCIFVIDIVRAYAVSPSARAILTSEQKIKFQTCIFQLCSAPFVDMTTGQQSLCKSVELLVNECWPMLYQTPEERLAVLLKLVRGCGTLLSSVLFRNVVEIVVKNGDLGKFVGALIQSEALNASLEMESFLTGDSSTSDSANSAKKSSKCVDNEKDAKKRNCFTEDSSNDLIVLITTIVLNDRRRILGLAGDVVEAGMALDVFYRVVDDFRATDALATAGGDEGARLVSHFMRHIFSHIVYCTSAGSPDGCPATSTCRGVALARDFVTFFAASCQQIVDSVLRLGKMSPTYMLYACRYLFSASLVSHCLPEIVDSFLGVLLFSKHHFIGSDNGRPLGLFLVSALQPLALALIEMDGSFSHFEQWLDAYVMSWQSALPSRTLHQRFNLSNILSSMRNSITIVHGCVLDLTEVSPKDLQFLNKEININALRGREITPILMTSDISTRDLHQQIRCFITRFGIGRVAEDIDGESSPMSFAEGSHIPPFRDVVQSLLFAISLFSVEVLSQEPVSHFPEDLIDFIHSGIFRSSLVSDFDTSQFQAVGDFISSISGQRPHVSYADSVEKLLSVFDTYLTNNNLQAVKIVANENVALRAVKRYSLAAFVRHMDLVEPIYSHLTRPGDGTDIASKLPIVSDVFRAVATILQHIVKQFQTQTAPAVDHSSVCSPIFFALRFLLNSVDQTFDFCAEISQRMARLRKKTRWRRAINFVARKQQKIATPTPSNWDDVALLTRDQTCRNLYKTWRYGSLDEGRLIACSKLTRFVQFAKISQITELKLRFRMHIELAVCQTETTQMLTEIFGKFSNSNFEQMTVSNLKAVPHLLEAFLAGLSFTAINTLQQSNGISSSSAGRYSTILSRKSERLLVDSWEKLSFKLVDALGQVSPLFSEHLQLSLLCPIVLHISSKLTNPESSSMVFVQGFLARLIRVLSHAVDQNGGDRLKTIAYPKCLVFERKVKEKKYRLDMNDEEVGPEMVQHLTVGAEVVRGPHWCWGDQDSSGPRGRSVGIVLRPVTADGWVRVRWANGITNNYRMGRDGHYDLRLAQDDQSAADNIGSANGDENYDDDDQQESGNRAGGRLNDSDGEQQGDEDEEFHSIESGAESIFEGSLFDDVRISTTSQHGGGGMTAKKHFQPLISLLTTSGQKFLQNFLKQGQVKFDQTNARRFLDFLLGLYEQFWSLKQHELAEGEQTTMTSLTLSGSDICFRDIYGFSLLHELSVNPLFARIIARDVNWLNFFAKLLKQIELAACRAHPHFFIATHIFVVLKEIFSQNTITPSDECFALNETIWSLFSTISSYLTTALTSPEPSRVDDCKVPLSATYSETIILHSIDCLRRIYANFPGIQKNINGRIQGALVSYSLLLDSVIVKSGKQCTEQDFVEVLPLLAFLGGEVEGRPYCGAEISAPVLGHIQLILPKSSATVLTRSLISGTQSSNIHLSKIALKSIMPFKLAILQQDENNFDELINLLVLKHISLLGYLDRLLLLAGVDSAAVTNVKKSLLFLSAKLFMQFVSSTGESNKRALTLTNAADFVQLIKAASKSTTVRPKYSPFTIQTALTPMIEICRNSASSSASSSSISLAQNVTGPTPGDDIDLQSLSLQTFSIDSSSKATITPQVLVTEGDLTDENCGSAELFEGGDADSEIENMDDSDGGVDAPEEEPHPHSKEALEVENLTTSGDDDDDTVTTIECGELVVEGGAGDSGATGGGAWDEGEQVPGSSGDLTVGEDDSDVRRLVEMGFSRSHIYEAYASLLADADSRAPSLDAVVNWLIENPPFVEDSSPQSGNNANLRRQLGANNRDQRSRQPLLRRSIGRFLSSTLIPDDGDDTLSLTLMGATSSSTSNEEGDDNAASSSEERGGRGDGNSRLRPPIAAFGRAVRRDHRGVASSRSPTVSASEIPYEITPESDVCVGQIVKSLARVDKVVFGETGYVLRVANEQTSTPSRTGLSTFSQFRPLNRLIGTSQDEQRGANRAEAASGGVKNVLVQWRLCGLRLWVSSTDVQPLSWPWEIKREIHIGDSVKVRDSVTTPRYKWGSVTHGSIGTVVALLDDLVYVNFQAQHRWAGLRKELEIIPSDAMVVCYMCDNDINVASDTIYYRCRKCRPPDFFVVCAPCRRRLSNSSHSHGLFAFVKTRGSIFTREERGSTSTFRPNASPPVPLPNPCNTWSACVSYVTASSNVSLLKHAKNGTPISWTSQPGVNPPHWIQLLIKPGVLLQSICVELDSRHSESLPNVLVLRIGQSSAHLRTVRTFPVAPDVVVVELLPKPLHKYYACVEIRIPGTRGGINAPCRINNLMVSPRLLPHISSSADQNVDEDESSDSKRSLTMADEDEILVLSSSSESEDGGDDLIHQNVLLTTGTTGTTTNGDRVHQISRNTPPTVVYGWGLNDKEQLARHGPVKVKQPFVEEPLPFSGMGVVSLSFGSKCSFFLTGDGEVYACGDTSNGRTGLGVVPDTVPTPRKLAGELSSAFISKISVHSGGRHALALALDGRVFSWGDGEHGKLGLGDETTQLEPKLIKFFADQSITVRSISAGSSHSGCITSAGELYTWGLGEFGRLGHSDTASCHLPKLVEAFRGREVIQVACGSRDAQTLVLTSDELVYSFGDGDFGKLGRDGNESCSMPTVIPDLTGLGVCQVECGAQFSLVRTKCGKVYTFGKGDYYRLGHGTESHCRRPQRIVGGGLSDEKVVDVAVGALHSLAICSSGKVYLWGDGDHYQQGNGSATANRIPTQLQAIPEGYKVIAASCGSSHTGIVCLPPGEKHHQRFAIAAPNTSPLASTTNLRLRALSSDTNGVKPAPLPFAIPFDPLGQTVIGLLPAANSASSTEPSVTVQPAGSSSSSSVTSDLKQSLAFKILSKNSENGGDKTKSNSSCRSSGAYVVHLLRSHIIYRFRSIVVDISERGDANEVFEKYFRRSAGADSSSLLVAFTRIFKLAIAGRMKLLISDPLPSPAPEQTIIATLTKVIKNCLPKLLLDTYLPELTEIACVSSVSIKTSPLDAIAPVVQESPHPYTEKSSLSGNVSIPGAASLRIIFDSQCSTEKRRDTLSICDYAGRIVSLKSGRDWLSDWATPDEIIVDGDFISWTFQSDAGSPAGWGFRFFVTCPPSSRSQQLLTFSDRKICAMPSLEVTAAIIPTASAIVNIDDDDSSNDNADDRTDRLALFLNALADIAKNGFIAPAYRNWAISLCAEICLAHKSDMFIERPLASLANLLTIQYDYEESVVRPGRHLVFSVFCRKLVSLALALRFDRLCPTFEQASWFQRLVQFMGISSSLTERKQWPEWFTAAVNFRIASSNPSAKDRDKDASAADDFLENSKFNSLQDEQLVSWYNSAPEEWTLSEAAGWRVFAFGHNHRGQLSLADGPKVKTPSSVPLIEQLEPVQIVGGEQSTFVVTREGRLYSMGYGSGGRLGLGGADSVSVPTLVRGLSDVQIVEVAVSSGGKHCLARSIEGQVWSWGENSDATLGHGNRLICDQPKLIEVFRGQSVTKVAAGSAHSAAITADGQLFTWGRGRYGRLGHGDSEDQLLPLAVTALRDHIVIDVACGSGDAQTLALTADGTVWSFGDGDYGKLGRGGSDGCRVPMIIPTLSDKDVIQVACGSQFSACLTRSGAVYTWGKGEYFRLGQGTTDHVRTPRRVAGLLGKRVIKMAVGSLHCLVLTADGEVYAFGDNDEGQLGDGSTQPAPRPRLISVLRNRPITHISAGSAHSFAWTVPSLSMTSMATKPTIRYPTGQLPVDCPSLTDLDRLVLRNRLLVFELFSENFWQSVPLLRFSELPDDFPASPLVVPLSASKLAPYLLLPHKEATLRRVVSLTTTRDRQHGPVINIDRVSRRSGTGQTVFDQLSTWLPTLLNESSLFLATRCWKVRFVAESVDDCGGGFSDSIADACEEIQAGQTGAGYPVGGPNNPCLSEDQIPVAMGGESSSGDHSQIVFRTNGNAESLRFFGVLMGIAIRTGSPLSVSIVPAMWRLLTSSPSNGLSIGDLRELDPALFTSLREIAQMPDDLLRASELPFAVPNIFGHLIPLLNSSGTIAPENRENFLNAAYSFRQHEFDEALRWIADGLGRVVPLPLLRLFTPAQLEWLVCGSPDVSVDVLRSITSYRGGLDSNSPLVRWFWDIVEELRPTERAQLLRFVWGRSRLPRRMSDFRGRDFVIQPLDKFGEPPAADAYLPEASTCFFMLKLPRYSCRDVLDARLRYAISACQSIDLDDYVSASGSGQMTVTEVLLNNPHHF